ncbi:hypothetical protein COY62_02025 [bacterium (Candidatus Howlettbacteria) CG_4_10_14_0_8_um_filter_40_9]|nr:MAG: hypothetical protein COY62_02025 [bacterium (Candidatus Howlettbacteria) CG_4_10_14_0_8_um_filter_40_9]
MAEKETPEQNQDQGQEQPQQPAQAPKAKSGSGMDQNVAGALCYVLGFITGIIFLLIEKDNKFVKFHAIQSIIFSLAVYAINFVVVGILFTSMMAGGFALLGLLSTGLTVLYVVLWIMLMVKAYNGEEWQIPVIGGIAKSMSEK